MAAVTYGMEMTVGGASTVGWLVAVRWVCDIGKMLDHCLVPHVIFNHLLIVLFLLQ